MLQFQTIPVTPFAQNATLLWDDQTQDAVLTDVGGEAEILLQEVASRHLNLQAIWLTHGHLDHVSGVPALLQHQSVTVLGPHQEDDFLLQKLPEITRQYRFPECPVFTPTHWLSDGDMVSVGNHYFQVLHIPGHTPGSVVYYCAEAKLLIAGDVLFLESVGRSDFPRGDGPTLLRGIREKLYTLPDDVQVITGHGAYTTIGHEKTHNPYVRAA